MSYSNVKYKYTDELYLSKKEFFAVSEEDSFDRDWALIQSYRSLYQFDIGIKKYDNFPFNVILTPYIMGKANTVERKLFEFSMLLAKHEERSNYSDFNTFNAYSFNSLKKDFMTLIRMTNLNFTEDDLFSFLNGDSVTMSNTPVGSFKTIFDKAIHNELLKGLSFESITEISKLFNARLYNYRDSNIYSSTSEGNDYTRGAQAFKIEDLMRKLFDLYNQDFELSPIVIASIIYFYFIYISPFYSNNEEIAVVLFCKVISDLGYGHYIYNLNVLSCFYNHKNQINQAIENAKKDGDVTFIVIAISDILGNLLDDKIAELKNIDLPEVKDIRIITNEVIKEVEVPQEVIREVEKVVYVDKPIEKIVYVDKPVEKIVYVDRIVEKEVEPVTQDNSNFVASDPSSFMDDDLTLTHYENYKDVLNEIRPYFYLDQRELALKITSLFPFIKKKQALFYASHREVGQFYSIKDYMIFASTSYETARTSMDLMVKYGLYTKEQFKNKFLYTPVK